MSNSPEVVARSLSSAQAATRRKLIDAAMALAAEGGYDAVGMRQVAAKAGVSTPTAYQYFSSKDHILVDALVELVELATEEAEAQPPRRHKSPADRAAVTLGHIVRRVAETPQLSIAVTRAFISGSPAVRHTRHALEGFTHRWIAVALAGIDVEDEEGLVDLFQSILLANMVELVIGTKQPEEIGPAVERAVRRVLS
jgi:AcrR family transcriptional regulator